MKLKNDRIYIDTSVIGGFFDVEVETKLHFKRPIEREIILVLSDLMNIDCANVQKSNMDGIVFGKIKLLPNPNGYVS